VHFFRNLWSLLLTPIVLLSGASASVMRLAGDEAIQATRREYFFDNDRLLLGAYNLNLLGNPNLGRWAAEAGLDFLVSHADDAFLDQCADAGIGVIAAHYNAPANYWDISDGSKAQWMSLTAAGYKGHPALWGDDLIDEPSSKAFGDISDLLGHYHSLSTSRMACVNLFPAGATAEQLGNEPQVGWRKYVLPGTTYGDEELDRYRRHVADYIKTIDTDYISYDSYPYNIKEDGTWWAWDNWLHTLDTVAEACRDTGRDLWAINQAAGNYIDGTDGNDRRYCDHKADHLQQGYAVLAFGAKAIIYACYQTGWWDDASHMVTSAGERTETYYAVQAANAELRPFAEKYGEYRWLGAYTVNSHKIIGLRYGLSNGLPKQERLQLSSCDGLLIGCFDQKEGVGKAYVIANLMELQDGKTATCAVNFPAGKTVTVYGGGEVKTYADGGSVELALAPGDGRFITVG
jgi:hypothetical protein